MNRTISALVAISMFTPSLAAQRAEPETAEATAGARVPVDLSLEGLGHGSRRASGTAARDESLGPSARRAGRSSTPLDCLESIADLASGRCLTASSTPMLGNLYPYPGLDNVFVPPAFVGGGENNQATEPWSTVAGGYGNIASGYYNAILHGHATVGGGRDNQATAPSSTVAGGELNLATGRHATVSGGKDNRGSETASTVGGGSRNTASDGGATVAGGTANTASGSGATVGGGSGNTASGNWDTVAGGISNRASGSQVAFTSGATVGGGVGNKASGTYCTVGGGRENTASTGSATVGGGRLNTASGGYATIVGGGGYDFGNTASGDWAIVGGGGSNTASGNFSTVVGGRDNTAPQNRSTVGGGSGNTASGYSATIPGGRSNLAAGNHSFAAGREAKANHNGAFVWGDSFQSNPGPSSKTSSANDQFNVYASGGVRMFTNSAATTGVLLAAGGSTWTMVSDRDAKENVEPVDARAVLDKVSKLPLASWNYKDQDDSIRHMGPMAQDFYEAFGLGLGEKTIDTIDPNGVALAAIQGLNAELEERLAEKDAEIEGLRARVERLERLVARAAPAK